MGSGDYENNWVSISSYAQHESDFSLRRAKLSSKTFENFFEVKNLIEILN